MFGSILVTQELRVISHSSPTHFFASYSSLNHRNTDKMSDAEKLPLAIAGIAFITLPFLAGMIALYAAK